MPTVQSILDRKGTDVATVDESATVLDAAQRMNTRHIGALVVTSGDRVVGIFTERDVLNRVVAAGRDPSKSKVKDVMTAPTICCRRDTKLAECRGVMTAKRIRHLPVVEDGHLFGLISSGDMLAAESSEQQATIQYLHDYMFGRT